LAGKFQTQLDATDNSSAVISLRNWPGWAAAIIFLGAVLRVRQYLTNRSLWYDEALLALNILHHPLREIFQPLEYHQGAPIGFLLLEKLAVLLAGKAGRSELALRIVPLAAGVGALFLFRHVARLFVSARAVVPALALFALCPSLIYYSSEVKQYSSDVSTTLALLWMLFQLVDSPLTPRLLLGCGAMGAGAVWFSHPASFVLAGAGGALIVATLWHHQWRRLGQLATAFAAWGTSFLICYFLSLRHLARDQSLWNYWNGAFPPHPLWSRKACSFLIDNFYTAFSVPAGLIAVLGAALFIVGCAQLARQRPLVFSLLSASIAVMLLAACLGRYPLEARLLLFLTPILLMAVAEGAIRCAELSQRRSPFLGIALMVLLLGRPVWTASKDLMQPPRLGDFKPALRYVLSRQRPGDDWYVYYGSKCQLAYYAELYELPPRNIRFGATCGDDAACYAADLAPVGGRTWVLLSHIVIDHGVDEGNVLVGQFSAIGAQLEGYRTRGGRAYLYDLKKPRQIDSPPSQDSDQSRPPSWDDACVSTVSSRSFHPALASNVR
jgi:hypothetical protein